MGLTYEFAFRAPATKSAEDLEDFLRGLEAAAQQMGFCPTTVVNGVFDTTERKQFSRRLTAGLPVEDARLKGANLPDDSRVWQLDASGGSCRVPPSSGVVLVVTNERGEETVMGFLRFPETVKDVQGRIVAETGLGGAWWFRDFLKTPDPRYRMLVRKFAEAGFLETERDDYA
jgi:hypothetical protein